MKRQLTPAEYDRAELLGCDMSLFEKADPQPTRPPLNHQYALPLPRPRQK